jgi:hypothetical protein
MSQATPGRELALKPVGVGSAVSCPRTGPMKGARTVAV